MLHVKVQDSPGLGVLLHPSEQLIIPLVGAVSDEHTNKKTHKTFVLCIQILSHSSLVIYKIRKKLFTSTTCSSTTTPASTILTGPSATTIQLITSVTCGSTRFSRVRCVVTSQ